MKNPFKGWVTTFAILALVVLIFLLGAASSKWWIEFMQSLVVIYVIGILIFGLLSAGWAMRNAKAKKEDSNG